MTLPRLGARSKATGRALGGSSFSRSPFGYLTQQSQGRAIVNAYRVLEDPAHPGFVVRIYDHNDSSHWFEQTDPTRQVAMPVAHADYGGQLCFTFTGAEWYDSNRPASQWLMHSGSGWSLNAVATLTSAGSRRLFATTSGGGFLGVDLCYVAGPNTTWFVGNASATVLNQVAAGIALNTPHQISGQYLEGGALPSEAAHKITGFAEINGDSVAVPSGAAAATMRIGANPTDNSLRFIGILWGGIFGPAFDADTRRGVREALQAITKVAY